MTGTEIYKRTATYEAEARSIRIHAPHWKVLLAYDGQRTLSEVAVSAETAFAETGTLLGAGILALSGLPHHPVDAVKKAMTRSSTH